ncbi:MAG TPA: IS4 family transposase [Polyangia bacterium]|nr:IS4 family transposase [Polyangia bacterium]
MRASDIVRSLLRRCIRRIHATRLLTLLAAVDALVRGGRASLTHLGRSLLAATTAKHRIKRIDRLLGNARLHRDLRLLYDALTRRLIGESLRPLIIVDWTQLHGDWWALSAAVPFGGRALPIYNEVHRSSGNGRAAQHRRFLRALRQFVPLHCRPTLIVDAGFCKPFWEACREEGFDLLVRLRPSGTLRAWRPERSATARELARRATSRAKCLGEWVVYAANCRGELLRVVCAKRTIHRARKDDRPYRQRAVEPWVLATTRRDLSADEVVALYAQRMKIEELFRDAKNSRYGWSLAHAGNRSAKRLAALLLITSLALVAVMLLGQAAEAAGCARFLQANSIRNRRVLSFFRVGELILNEYAARRKILKLKA